MNGAEALVATAAQAGVEVCFANPGTTEMPPVAALDGEPPRASRSRTLRGRRDGRGRRFQAHDTTSGNDLLHLGPGAAHGIANLHNARHARTPVLNVIGDHATWHVHHDPPLTSDITSLRSPVSAWIRTAAHPGEVAGDTADAIAASQCDGGGVATLVVPADCQWEPAGQPAEARPRAALPEAPTTAVDSAAAALRSGEPTVLLLGGAAMSGDGLRAAARVAPSPAAP